MPLFRHLVYKEILRVLNVTSVKEYAPGEEIIKEGTPGDEMYVLLRGKIRLHKNDAFITHLEPGAHIGEMALVDRRHPRSASATAEERSRVLILSRKDFYEIIRKEPQLSTKLLWAFTQVLADRLRKTTAELSGARLEAGAEDLTDDVLFEDRDGEPPTAGSRPTRWVRSKFPKTRSTARRRSGPPRTSRSAGCACPAA